MEAIANVKEIMQRQNFKPHNLDSEDIGSLLAVILRNTFFTFENLIFLQVSGLPMGSSVSGILAILFMDTLERQALLSSPSVGLYARYVDDIFVLVESKDKAEELLATMNQQHEKIKFELEHPVGDNTLHLLDFAVTIDKDAPPQFDFYRKKAKRDIFVHAKSALPWQSKMSIIRNEKHRIRERCTGNNSAATHLHKFEDMLTKNGYTQQDIDRSATHSTHSNRQPVNSNTLFFQMPFISDRLNHKIRRIFKQEGFNTIVYNKNRSLRQTLSQNKNNHSHCSLNACPLADPKLCQRKSVVYQVECTACHKAYLGSTIRQLHQRIKEHLSSDQSAVKRHLSTCAASAQIAVTVLSHDNDEKNLRLREAILIMDLKPQLNAREEEQTLLTLVQPVRKH